MGGCVAFGCPNRSEHGYCLKVFPKDPERRAIWAANVNRKNWTPTDSSRLCEMHFESRMWEVDREDGRRKLKANAVPTIFAFQHIKKHIKLPVPRKLDIPQRLVHYEPSMWETDSASGKRKLKPDAVPSLSVIKKMKLPDLRTPKKVLSEHNYIRHELDNDVELPYPFMPEVYVVGSPSTVKYKKRVAESDVAQNNNDDDDNSGDDCGSGGDYDGDDCGDNYCDDIARSVPSESGSKNISSAKSSTAVPKLRTYCNKRKCTK